MSNATFQIPSPSMRFVLREGETQYNVERPVLDTPAKVYEFFSNVVEKDVNFESGKESVVLYLLDTRLALIGYSIVSVGTVNSCPFHPREILRAAILGNAAAFSVSHSHPSGDPSPSRADELATQKLYEAAKVVDINLVDHIVTGKPAPGRSSYYSFREAGLI